MREVAALGGEFGDLGEEAAIVTDEVEAGEDDGDEDGREEEIELALNAIVDMRCGVWRVLRLRCFGRGGEKRRS